MSRGCYVEEALETEAVSPVFAVMVVVVVAVDDDDDSFLGTEGDLTTFTTMLFVFTGALCVAVVFPDDALVAGLADGAVLVVLGFTVAFFKGTAVEEPPVEEVAAAAAEE